MKKLLLAWIFSLVSMLALSYLWHGVLLNDLRNVHYPSWFFFLLLLLVYSIISLILTGFFNYTSTNKNFISKGFFGGAAFGFFIYLIAFTLGVSFKSHETKHIVVDFIWQMVEQGIGGLVISYVFLVSYSIQKVAE
jgi:hypothetical protein